VTPVRLQGLFAIMDDDGSETLDKQEFLDVMKGLVKFAGKSSPSLLARSKFDSSNSDDMCALAFFYLA
jgi:Ca2+-binding EF-hand superfamily protein